MTRWIACFKPLHGRRRPSSMTCAPTDAALGVVPAGPRRGGAVGARRTVRYLSIRQGIHLAHPRRTVDSEARAARRGGSDKMKGVIGKCQAM